MAPVLASYVVLLVYTGKLGTNTVLKSKAPNSLRAGEIEAERYTLF